MPQSFQGFRLSAVLLALVAGQGFAAPVMAQAGSPEDRRTIQNYRLTMPMLRKVLPARNAPGGASCKENRARDPHSLRPG